MLCLDQKHGVDASVVFAVVCDLSPSTPDDLAACSDETEFGDVDFDDGTLGENAELCVPKERLLVYWSRQLFSKHQDQLTWGSEGSS